MNNFKYLFEDYKDWSTKYHYWDDESNNNFDYLKNLVDTHDYETLYDIFSSRRYKIKHLSNEVDFIDFIKDRVRKSAYRDFISSSDIREFLKSSDEGYIKEFIYNLFDKLFSMTLNSFNKKIYRILSIDDLNEFDKNDLGICWTYDESVTENPWMFGDDKRYTVILYATVDEDNIDWLESLFLSLMYGTTEKEYRIKNPSQITLIDYKVIDNGEI